jgi:hypothetical protein
MRIRVIQKPIIGCIDGIQLGHFLPGQQYEVGAHLGNLFLAERWAVPVIADEPALVIPVSELQPDAAHAAADHLDREIYPPCDDGSAAFEAESRRSRRRARRGSVS